MSDLNNESLEQPVNPNGFFSWIFDEATNTWVPPTPQPETGGPYFWHEGTKEWRKVSG